MARYRSHSDTALTMMQHALDERDIPFRLDKRDVICDDPEANDIADDFGLTKVKEAKK